MDGIVWRLCGCEVKGDVIELRAPRPATPGERIAVVSPAWAAPAFFPEIHERGLAELERITGLIPVEYPTTRQLSASAGARAADVMAALTDPSIAAVICAMGGDDELRLWRHLDPEALKGAEHKPVLGYSDNTVLLHWLWMHGRAAFHGGSTMVHLGSGGGVDAEHAASLRAALSGDLADLVITAPEETEDFGFDWSDPQALRAHPPREKHPGHVFLGGETTVRGHTWGGCLEVLDQLAFAGVLPQPEQCEGAIMIAETSEIQPPADMVGRWFRGLGERGILEHLSGLIVARPVTDSRESPRSPALRAALDQALTDHVMSEVSRYAPQIPVVTGVSFGHTRPQWILPYGGDITINPGEKTVTAHFGV